MVVEMFAPLASGAGTLTAILVVLALLLPVCLAAFVFILYLPYMRNRFEVREITQGGVRVHFSGARECNTDGITTYKLSKFGNVELPPPKKPGCVLFQKNKKFFVVTKHLNGLWEYVQFSPNYGKDTELSTISLKWIEHKIREKREKYLKESWWDKNKHVVMLAGTIGAIMIVMIVWFKFNTDAINRSLDIIAQSNQIGERIATLLEHGKTIPEIIP